MMTMLLASLALAADCQEERAAALAIGDAVSERYVIAEQAERDGAELHRRALMGEFDRHCSDKKKFARFMTSELRKLTGDKHYYVEYAPASEQQGDNDWVERWRNGAPAQSFGVRKVERLDGNIAYIDMPGFYEYAPAEDALTAAFTLVSTSDALILDLRYNDGGSSETAWPVTWTFLTAGSPIARRMDARIGTPESIQEPDFNWPRYGSDRPLVILISDFSLSAAEAVAHYLQAEGRAVIIGENSGGAAHMLGDAVAIGNGWKIGIPESRPINLKTTDNWENTGVTPDILIPADQALEKALDYLKTELAEREDQK
ncbi:MAG: S41 family peptidase [Pseudomonadota bacterium]